MQAATASDELNTRLDDDDDDYDVDDDDLEERMVVGEEKNGYEVLVARQQLAEARRERTQFRSVFSLFLQLYLLPLREILLSTIYRFCPVVLFAGYTV